MNRCLLSAALFLTALLAVSASVAGCRDAAHRPADEAEPEMVQFQDITESAGIRFVHHSGAYGAKFMPETVGSGVAFLDYDSDGLLDLLYVDSCPWPNRRTPDNRTRPHLYRNQGDGSFEDVTLASGLDFNQYGMGVAASDYDNDGDTDLYFTALGSNRLMRNEGNGRFRDVTLSAGVAGESFEPGGLPWKWSSSASWLDYDRDGRLDLVVLNYVRWTPETDVWCGSPQAKSYCPPSVFEGLPMTLYRNLGSGRFENVSARVGLTRSIGKGFGVAVADFNQDGWPDIAVANDTEANFLFLNQGGKRFEERASENGIAVGPQGTARAGMGIDTADWHNDGRFGLLIGNFAREGLALLRNRGDAFFEDEAMPAGMAGPSQLFLTFGAFFFDFDNDGWQDALAANGHIDDFVNSKDSAITYEQRPLIYRNRGDGSFREVGQSLGPAPNQRIVARGAAYGDIDNDGDLDVALLWNNRKGILWRNDGGNRNHWIGFQLQGTRCNRDAIGAVVKVTAGGVTRTALRKSGGSFLSEHHPRVVVGLGSHATSQVEVLWPDGSRSAFRDLAADRYYRLVQDSKVAAPLKAGTAASDGPNGLTH